MSDTMIACEICRRGYMLPPYEPLGNREVQWSALELIGYGGRRGGDRPPTELEMRRCACGAVLAVDVCRLTGHEEIEERRGEPVTAFRVCRRCGKIGDRL